MKRADEDFVYGLSLEDFSRLPELDWEFRDRRIWNFSATNVAQITLRQNGKTRQLLHTGVNKWSLARRFQGIIDPQADRGNGATNSADSPPPAGLAAT